MFMGYTAWSGKLYPKVINDSYIKNAIAAQSDWLDEYYKNYRCEFNGVNVPGIKGKKNTLVYGDSLSLQFLPRAIKLVKETAGERGVGFVDGGAYPPFPGSTRSDGKYAGVYERFARAAQDETIDTIIITGIWSQIFNDAPWSKLIIKVDGEPMNTASGFAKTLKAWDNLIASIPNNVRIIFVLTTPISEKLNPVSMITRTMFPPSIGFEQNRYVSESEIRNTSRRSDDIVRSIASKHNIEIIDPLKFFCKDGMCKSTNGGKPIFKDRAHITTSYMIDHVTFLDDFFLGTANNK